MVLCRKSTGSSAQVVSWKRWRKVSRELNAIALVDDLISLNPRYPFSDFAKMVHITFAGSCEKDRYDTPS